jgi:hypothetical protein
MKVTQHVQIYSRECDVISAVPTQSFDQALDKRRAWSGTRIGFASDIYTSRQVNLTIRSFPGTTPVKESSALEESVGAEKDIDQTGPTLWEDNSQGGVSTQPKAGSGHN